MKHPGIVLVFGLAVMAAAYFPASAPTQAQDKPKGDVEAGKVLYTDNCQKCHGSQGQGNTRMYKLANAKIIHLGAKEAQEKSDELVRKSLTEGFGKMEKVEGLTPEQVENILAFFRTLKEETPKND